LKGNKKSLYYRWCVPFMGQFEFCVNLSVSGSLLGFYVMVMVGKVFIQICLDSELFPQNFV
jgi:hypothetical protein